MDTCPPEIHCLIFSSACSDGGYTGRSLSLVSRYVHDVSAPYRWQSLAISGVNEARGFASVLRKYERRADVHQRRPIYHLFLSTRRSVDAGDDHSVYDWQSVHQEDWPTYQARILMYAAPTLDTLAFVGFDPFFSTAMCVQELLKVPFPHLTELTIRGRCTPSQFSLVNSLDETVDMELTPDLLVVDPSQPGEPSLIRPKLRRLHLACAYHGFIYGSKATANLIHAFSPNITHLRLSMLDMWGVRRVADILHAECADLGIVPSALGLNPLPAAAAAKTTCKAQMVNWARVIPQDVQRFVIQPSPTAVSGFYCSCCMEVRGDADVVRVFEGMAREADERFGYMPARDKIGYSYVEAKTDWLERIVEGNGCWQERILPVAEDERPPTDGSMVAAAPAADEDKQPEETENVQKRPVKEKKEKKRWKSVWQLLTRRRTQRRNDESVPALSRFTFNVGRAFRAFRLRRATVPCTSELPSGQSLQRS